MNHFSTRNESTLSILHNPSNYLVQPGINRFWDTFTKHNAVGYETEVPGFLLVHDMLGIKKKILEY